jgi:glycosyltransferase involved in cell wall biosynthesis
VLSNYYARLDIVLAPYQRRVALRGGRGDIARWMSPLKIFEYMAAGKPVVASDLPVLREVLEDGREALLVPPDDIEAWAAAIERLLASPELRQRLSRSAHQKFMRQFTWQARARKMLHGALR